MPKSATIACRPLSRIFSGLMFAMEHAVLVSVVQRVGHFAGDAEGVEDRKLAFAIESLAY